MTVLGIWKGWGGWEGGGQSSLQCLIAKVFFFFPLFFSSFLLPSLPPYFLKMPNQFSHIVWSWRSLPRHFMSEPQSQEFLASASQCTFSFSCHLTSLLSGSPFVTEWGYHYKLPCKSLAKHSLNKSTKCFTNLRHCSGFEMELGNGKGLLRTLVHSNYPPPITFIWIHILLKKWHPIPCGYIKEQNGFPRRAYWNLFLKCL